MIRPFGIVGKLLAIGLIGLLAMLTVLGFLLYMLRANEGTLQRKFPLPNQIAAIVQLIETTPEAERGTLLDALNSPSFGVSIGAGPPMPTPGARQRPGLAALFSRFKVTAGRQVIVESLAALAGPDTPVSNWRDGVPSRVAVSLKGGTHLEIRTHGALLSRLWGVPAGFWLAAISLGIAAATIAALVRAVRPVRQLTGAIEAFSQSADLVPVEPSGAADVRRLIDTVNRMQERMAALVKGRTILAGAISHDIRTYLTRLRLRLDLLEDDTERLAAERDVDAMLEIIDSSLAFARATASDKDREELDLSALAAGVVSRYREDERDVTLDTAAPVVVRADAAALKRVLSNLVDNALRYGSHARLSVAGEDGFAVLCVDDDGPGVPPGEREAVFEPFYRLDPSRNLEHGGTGLGLALCRQIIDAHAGRITIETAPRGGARLRVLLPLSEN